MHTRRSFVNVQSLSCCIDYSRRSHNIVSVVVVGVVAWHADVSPAGDCRARPRLGPARPDPLVLGCRHPTGSCIAALKGALK